MTAAPELSERHVQQATHISCRVLGWAPAASTCDQGTWQTGAPVNSCSALILNWRMADAGRKPWCLELL